MFQLLNKYKSNANIPFKNLGVSGLSTFESLGTKKSFGCGPRKEA
jgi:hypothetical protein